MIKHVDSPKKNAMFKVVQNLPWLNPQMDGFLVPESRLNLVQAEAEAVVPSADHMCCDGATVILQLLWHDFIAILC